MWSGTRMRWLSYIRRQAPADRASQSQPSSYFHRADPTYLCTSGESVPEPNRCWWLQSNTYKFNHPAPSYCLLSTSIIASTAPSIIFFHPKSYRVLHTMARIDHTFFNARISLICSIVQDTSSLHTRNHLLYIPLGMLGAITFHHCSDLGESPANRLAIWPPMALYIPWIPKLVDSVLWIRPTRKNCIKHRMLVEQSKGVLIRGARRGKVR